MIRKVDKRRKLLTETEETMDTTLVEANFQDMQEQISVIQEQLQMTNASDTSLATISAYSEVILLLLDNIYNELL